jgi:hypothetical protein
LKRAFLVSGQSVDGHKLLFDMQLLRHALQQLQPEGLLGCG